MKLFLPLFFTLSFALAQQPLSLTATPNAFQGNGFPELLPAPQEARLGEGFLGLENLSIRLEGTQPELGWAARDINREVQARLNPQLAATGARTIRIGTLENSELAELAKARNLTPQKPEGYALWVEAEGAAVVGFDALGAYRGAQTLRQLLTAQGFRFAQIRDWPTLPLRMAMIYLDKDSERINNVLVPLLARLKFNRVLVMSNYVQWNSTRNIWHPNGATRLEAERVAKMIREHGMEPIPLIELLGHAQWLFYNTQTGKFDANLDLHADPEAPNPYAYDPLVPRVYEVVLPILSEAVEVFKPQFVHIGHDEVAAQNRFPAKPEAMALGLPKLFVDDTVRLYNHLKSLKVGTMLWHDVAFSDAHREAIAPNLPKDIIVTFWNYSPAADYPPIKTIQDLGFRVIGSSWNAAGSPESMAKSILSYGALGALQTRWSGYFGNSTMFDGQAEQAVAYFNAANAFWNPAIAAPVNVVGRYRDAWRPQTFTALAGRTVDLSAVVTRKLTDPDETQWIQKGASTDLSALPTGLVRLGAYQFNISGAVMTKGSRAAATNLPQSVTMNLGTGVKARALVFLHTTGWASTQRYERIGQYVLTFSDGSKGTLPLEYARHITAWTDLTVRNVVYDPVWRGKTADGLDVGLNVLVWNNPKPDLEIRSVTLESAGSGANPTLIGLMLLDQALNGVATGGSN